MRFDRNNLRKVLLSPLLLTGRIASVFVRRDPKLWVFGSGIGFGEGGVSLSAAAHAAGLSVIWLSNRPTGIEAATAAGYRAERAGSVSGWWHTLRAGTIVVSHGLGDVNPYAQHGANIIQLWHGVPLKHLHRDAGVTYSLPRFPGSTLAERMLRAGSERAYRSITHFVAASDESGRRLASAFGLGPEQVLVAGDPRDDILLRGTEAERTATARALIESALGSTLADYVVMFAPTWRDGEPDPVVPTTHEWDALELTAADLGASILIRPHPLAVGAYRDGIQGRSGLYLLDVTKVADITPALPACDVLITDYSSIAYDFALLGRPMLYLTPDLEQYAASRGFYESIEVFCDGSPARTWREVLAQLRGLDDEPTHRAAVSHARETAARVHGYFDGENTRRVLEAALSR